MSDEERKAATDVPSKEELERILLQLQVERMLREEEAKLENARRMAEIRRMSLNQLREAEQQRLQFQANCHHLKQNGESALAGQRVHTGNTVLTCQICGKIFRDNEVPPHLRVPADAIGGPEYH